MTVFAAVRLYEDLRIALAALYSLPPPSVPARQMSQHEAHEFLMKIQGRNVRRQLQSIRQSQAAKQNSERSAIAAQDIDWGSSWLACILLLLMKDAHPTERLFCAQTLMHRIRRTKLEEAIDWEVESAASASAGGIIEVVNGYIQWITTIHADLGQKLNHQLSQMQSILEHQNEQERESTLKGQLSLHTITYLAVKVPPESQQPLLVTLGSAMAAIALRLRYTPQSVHQRVDNAAPGSAPVSLAAPHTLPLVQMISTVLHEYSGTLLATDSTTAAAIHCACLGAIPDTILASPGGARGKLSIDPKCVDGAHEELKHTTSCQSLLLMSRACISTSGSGSTAAHYFWWACERWSRYLTLPWDFISTTLEQLVCLLRQEGDNNKPIVLSMALPYLIGIFEAASWTEEEILSFSVGLGSGGNHDAAKKKQSSKSKKRHKQVLEDKSTETRKQEAQQECWHRGNMACRTAQFTWQHLEPHLYSSPNGMVLLCTCSNSCFVHWVKHCSNSGENHEELGSLIQSIARHVQQLCQHNDRNVRSQAYEPLCKLHEALQATNTNCAPWIEDLMVKHLYNCSMQLATSCGYPTGYFDNMTLDNDVDLEVERNDVRDVLRAVGGGEDVYTGPPSQSSIKVLEGIVHTCVGAICNQLDASTGLPHETSLHALSSLAKPLNRLSESFSRNQLTQQQASTAITLLNTTCHGFAVCAEKLSGGIPRLASSQVFALSRLLNLGMASLCPSFLTICKSLSQGQHLGSEIGRTIRSAMRAAAVSIVYIPELAAVSTLDHCQYDIRGAFRSPGGEDHVGVLLLMRLSAEGPALTREVVRLGHEDGMSLLMDLCKIHEELKKFENERGPGILHGRGVTPRTRRILLDTISRLTDVAKSTAGLVQDGGRDADAQLRELFRSAVASIASNASRPLDAGILFQICEVTNDIASFSSAYVSSLFQSSPEPLVQGCVAAMVNAGISGYSSPPGENGDENAMIQWGRLRGALVNILTSSAVPDLSDVAVDAVTALQKAECDAILSHCLLNDSKSSVFKASVVSEETLPAGAFIRLVGHVLEGSKTVCPGCVRLLSGCSGFVLQTLLSEHSSANHPFEDDDPRPFLAEAWFLTLVSLANCCIALTNDVSQSGTDHEQVTLSMVHNLMSETGCACIMLLLHPSLDRLHEDHKPTDSWSRTMSMDGPHSLALMSFLERAFSLGLLSPMAHCVQAKLGHCLLLADDAALADPMCGMAVIAASLFRAVSGSLPPWAVDGIPHVHHALFSVGCHQDTVSFCRLLQASMEIRFCPPSNNGYTAVAHGPSMAAYMDGSLLAGRFLDKMKPALKEEFLMNCRQVCTSEAQNTENWKRRLKSFVKQACGGKKKGNKPGFNLKPSPTSWDYDRL